MTRIPPRWRAVVVALTGVVVIVAAMFVGRATVSDDHTAAHGLGPSAVDVGFCQAMSEHHQQAALMVQLTDGRLSATTAQIARSIESNQLVELGRMQGWLQIWDAPLIPPGDPMAWTGDEMTHGASNIMPGMATQSQLDELATATGSQVDTRFLELMTAHHRAGVSMAQTAIARASTPQVRSLAAAMVRDEVDEINYMQAALTRIAN